MNPPTPVRSSGGEDCCDSALPHLADATLEPKLPGIELTSELLLLPDGRILAHHLTPELAVLLQSPTTPITDQ